MNDFTKEELEDILETYYQIAEHSDIELKVIDKIQSLIVDILPALKEGDSYGAQAAIT